MTPVSAHARLSGGLGRDAAHRQNMYRQSVVGQRDALEAQAVAAAVAADVVPAVQKLIEVA